MTPNPTPCRALPSLRRTLRAYAAAALALPRRALSRAMWVIMRDREHQVAVCLAPRGGAFVPPGGEEVPARGIVLPGLHLSTFEQRIWDALGGGPLTGKEIAAALGIKHEAKSKYILANLKARRVIRKALRGQGYERCPCPPAH